MYLDFYKLSSKPFQLTPDLNFLFPSKGHKRALAYLHYGLEQREGFVVITGDVGTGKTMLIEALVVELADQKVATTRVEGANLGAESLISTVSAAFGRKFEGRGKVALLEDLRECLLNSQQYLDSVLLIVDEAQTLTPAALEELRILSNLQSNGRALMQIFLVGQMELMRTLTSQAMEQLRQRVIASYKLEPLSAAETNEYITYRLRAAGWDDDPKFSEEVLAEIHKCSKGIPRKINLLMDRMLVYGFLEELHELQPDHIGAVLKEMGQELAGDLGGIPRSMRAKKTPAQRVEHRLSAIERMLGKLTADESPDQN